MDVSLEGKVALVTGASRGIGKAIAAGFAEAGAKVMLSSRKQADLEAAAAEIGGDVAVFAAHVGKPEDAVACVDATIERFGGLDILVNNAGANPYFGATMEVDEARYDKTFEVNLAGRCSGQQAWGSVKDKPGVVINIASVGGMRTEFGLGVYNVTKAALIHLTRQLAGELGPTRVVGIAPGLVQTDFAAYLVENFGDALAARMPTRRLGVPEDIANLAVFLASDRPSWITGDTYVIDGGAGVAQTADGDLLGRDDRARAALAPWCRRPERWEEVLHDTGGGRAAQ